MDRIENLREQAMMASARVALWPMWKRGNCGSTSHIPRSYILKASVEMLRELLKGIKERQQSHPFPELNMIIKDIEAVISRTEEDLIPDCDSPPLMRLGRAAEE